LNSAINNYYAFYCQTGGIGHDLYYSYKYNYYNDYGSWFNVIVYKSGLIAKFKIWKDGDAEPVGWDWEGNLPAGTIDQGKLHARSDIVDANGCGFDDIEIYHYVLHPETPEIPGIISGLYSETA